MKLETCLILGVTQQYIFSTIFVLQGTKSVTESSYVLFLADMFLLELQNSPVCFSAWTLFNLDMAALRTVSPTCFLQQMKKLILDPDQGTVPFPIASRVLRRSFVDAEHLCGLFPGSQAVCSGH